jgi:hypothetical protein
MADISTPCHIENENYIYHLYNKNKKMYVIFYFISNLILITILVVYLILLDFDLAEPLFDADSLDSVEKTLINKVMVIEDYIVLEQIRKLVLRIFIAYHDKRMITALRPKLLHFVICCN